MKEKEEKGKSTDEKKKLKYFFRKKEVAIRKNTKNMSTVRKSRQPWINHSATMALHIPYTRYSFKHGDEVHTAGTGELPKAKQENCEYQFQTGSRNICHNKAIYLRIDGMICCGYHAHPEQRKPLPK